jgi:hypothetical protein
MVEEVTLDSSVLVSAQAKEDEFRPIARDNGKNILGRISHPVKPFCEWKLMDKGKSYNPLQEMRSGWLPGPEGMNGRYGFDGI